VQQRAPPSSVSAMVGGFGKFRHYVFWVFSKSCG
jgi:hypothetical protein